MARLSTGAPAVAARGRAPTVHPDAADDQDVNVVETASTCAVILATSVLPR
jgi:hypothetical protein